MSARCRNGHDLSVVGTVRGNHCRACQNACVRRYQRSAKFKAVRQHWKDGKVEHRTFFDCDTWAAFVAIVGPRRASTTVQHLVREFVKQNVRKTDGLFDRKEQAF